MSIDAVTQALKDDPALLQEVMAAGTPAERAAILKARGIAQPDAHSQFPDMADTAGGSEGTMTETGQAAAATAAAG
ncbi:MAG: hypothetical protein U0R64_00955 [Candidatus Nanopelagicales bacterium]